MKAKDRIKIYYDKRVTTISIDNVILFIKDGFSWKYIKQYENDVIYEHMKSINDKHLKYFIDDICEQLDNGTDRNNLIINIPEEIIKLKIGDKILDL